MTSYFLEDGVRMLSPISATTAMLPTTNNGIKVESSKGFMGGSPEISTLFE